MVDEAQSGLCRTGKWFAFQHFGVKPDVNKLKLLGMVFQSLRYGQELKLLLHSKLVIMEVHTAETHLERRQQEKSLKSWQGTITRKRHQP